MPNQIAPNVLSWASELDELTAEQAARTARLPILAGPLALMPDAHFGLGATIGSVLATGSAVIPSAVGVDIGCGMAATPAGSVRTRHLPDAGLDGWVAAMRRRRPGRPRAMARGGFRAAHGKWIVEPRSPGDAARTRSAPPRSWDPRLGQPLHRARRRSGRLGLDPSASGISGTAATSSATLHTKVAKRPARAARDRARGSGACLAAEGNRRSSTPTSVTCGGRRLRAGEPAAPARRRPRQLIEGELGRELADADEVNCHHNYTELEEHDGQVALDRRGRVRSAPGWGRAGSSRARWGRRSFLVRGTRQRRLSYASCSHGAGRRMSRTKAGRPCPSRHLESQMAGQRRGRPRTRKALAR